MSLRVVFLDRDGVINVDRGAIHRTEDWRFTRQAPRAIRQLRDAGFRIAVVTNQSGVARGQIGRSDVERMHDHMRLLLQRQGASVDAVAYCPHAPSEACCCRKPQTGLLGEIVRRLGEPIDFRKSWVVGDKPSDMEFGRAIGARTALIRSVYWRRQDLAPFPDLIGNDLYTAAPRIIKARGEAHVRRPQFLVGDALSELTR